MTARSDEIKQRDARLKELRADLDKAEALVSEMRERRSSTRGSLGFRLSAPSLPSAMAPIGRLSNTSNAATLTAARRWHGAPESAPVTRSPSANETLAKGRELVLDLAPPLADRFVFEVALIDYGPVLLRITFGSRLAAGTLPPKLIERWLQVRLGRLRLSPSCPFRLLHALLSLRPARLPPAFGYGAPPLSAGGTSTLPIWALPGAPYVLSDSMQGRKDLNLHLAASILPPPKSRDSKKRRVLN